MLARRGKSDANEKAPPRFMPPVVVQVFGPAPSSATTNMSSAPIYSPQQERQLFGHTLRCLQPEYISFDGRSFKWDPHGGVKDEDWQSWLQVEPSEVIASGPFKGSRLPQDLVLHQPGGDICGTVLICIDKHSLPPHERLVEVSSCFVNEEHRQAKGNTRLRTGALLLQLVLQLARLSKVHGVLVEETAAQPFYRSLGFFSFAPVPDKVTSFFIAPEHAFNTITGLLNTRSTERPAEHHKEVARLPSGMQAVYRLQYQHWDVTSTGFQYEMLRFDLSICNLPKRQPADKGHHAQLVEYGRVAIRVHGGVVEVGEPVDCAASAEHWATLKAALLSIGTGMGQDIAKCAWHFG
jgi:hypothetical protein